MNNIGYTDLYSGKTVTISGSASKRLFLVTRMSEDIRNSGLEIISMGSTIRVVSSAGRLMVKVYDINGMVVATHNDGGYEANISLQKGIYIVEATDAKSGKNTKILLR